jgi:hypothetical protein
MPEASIPAVRSPNLSRFLRDSKREALHLGERSGNLLYRRIAVGPASGNKLGGAVSLADRTSCYHRFKIPKLDILL